MNYKLYNIFNVDIVHLINTPYSKDTQKHNIKNAGGHLIDISDTIYLKITIILKFIFNKGVKIPFLNNTCLGYNNVCICEKSSHHPRFSHHHH